MSRFAPVPSAAVDDERLSNLDLLVLMALGYHTDAAGWCWPSQSTIAKKARLNRTTVTACIPSFLAASVFSGLSSKNRHSSAFN